MKKQIKKQQSGRSMIEMVGVLAVMGLITAGAFVLISSANSSQKRNRAIDDFMEIAAGVRSLYAEHDTFPAATVMTNTTVMTALGKSTQGPYSGSTYEVARASDTTFTVKLTGMPANDCSALAIKQWRDATSPTCNNGTFSVTFNK